MLTVKYIWYVFVVLGTACTRDDVCGGHIGVECDTTLTDSVCKIGK